MRRAECAGSGVARGVGVGGGRWGLAVARGGWARKGRHGGTVRGRDGVGAGDVRVRKGRMLDGCLHPAARRRRLARIERAARKGDVVLQIAGHRAARRVEQRESERRATALVVQHPVHVRLLRRGGGEQLCGEA